MSDVVILGFDVREMWLPFGSGWTEERRELYCLRKDVDRVLSVDRRVWLSVFEADEELVRPSERIGYLNVLWDSYEALLDYLKDAWPGRQKPCWCIAVTVLLEFADNEGRREWRSRVGESAYGELGAQWSLVGYDVSDVWLISGLSDCGYDPERNGLQALREAWCPRLNKYHLFANPHDAAEFAKLSDERVPEHAPFFVCGVWHSPMLSDRIGAP